MAFVSQNIKIWLHGLFAAAIGSFATAASGAVVMPNVFNFTHEGLLNMLKLSVVPALASIFTYLKQSPLPALTNPENGQK